MNGRSSLRVVLSVALCAICVSSASGMIEDSLRVAPFGPVMLYRETERPGRVVLFVSGDGGWNKGVVDMARMLAGMDALVAGVDITRYLKSLDCSGESCLYPAADFENLGKVVQQHCGFPNYVTPVLVGYSSGATLVYATLVQAPTSTFRGGISLGFCPDLEVRKPFCKGSGLEWKPLPKGNGWWFLPARNLQVPWIALQGMVDQVCMPDSTIQYVSRVENGRVVQLPKVGHGYAVYANWVPQFKAAFQEIQQAQGLESTPVTVPELPDLPLEVVESAASGGNALALHITGDGGWGVTDKGLAHSLADHGIPVVALNSLHYFWKPKTPEVTARDVAAILEHYLTVWKKDRIILIGYSFGADVMPFVINRLPEELRTKVSLVVFLSLSDAADFEFHMTSWLGASGRQSLPTRPEVEKLRGTPMLCVYGREDRSAVCKDLPADLMQTLELSGSHRIGSGYEEIVTAILQAVRTE